MDLKQIQELVKLVNKSNIGELSIEQPDFKIKIKQHQEAVSYVNASPGYLPQGAPQQLTSPSPATQSSATEDKKANAETQILDIHSLAQGLYFMSVMRKNLS